MTVLLAHDIERLCKTAEPMIEPFDTSRLRAASYQLTLGPDIHIGGEEKRLEEGKHVVLEPHQMAVVCTRETLWIPRHVIARWSLRVTQIYEGLLWTGGPQVDPGWKGQLFCPIYNLAERPVVLQLGQGMFTIDFSLTSPLDRRYLDMKRDSDNFPDVWFKTDKPITLSAHDKHRLRSAPYEALRELRELRYFRRAANVAGTLMLLLLTLMVGGLAVVAGSQNTNLKIPIEGLAFWLMIGGVLFLVVAFGTMNVLLLWKLRRLLSDI